MKKDKTSSKESKVEIIIDDDSDLDVDDENLYLCGDDLLTVD